MSNFRKFLDTHALPAVVGAFVLGLVIASVAWGLGTTLTRSEGVVSVGSTKSAALPSPTRSPSPKGSSKPSAKPSPDGTTQPAAPAAAAPVVKCSGGTSVSTAAQLTSALSAAKAGTTITLAPGTYQGNFVASSSGTASAPIVLCGQSTSILDGGGTSKNYVFHLDGASYWQLKGFTVQNGQKGVMADSSVGSVIEGLTVTNIGDEGIHLRKNSTDNTVSGNVVNNTGQHKSKFGEGIYVGTAKSNWCDITDCKPDNSDRNVIENNTISRTSSENVDIKEGTSNGILRNNSFDGAGMSAADSWVDVKGNGWMIDGNSGVNSPLDGFQTHNILDDWGNHNTFSDNTAAVNGPGFGIASRPALDNVVECNNTVTGAASGMSNVTCSK